MPVLTSEVCACVTVCWQHNTDSYPLDTIRIQSKHSSANNTVKCSLMFSAALYWELKKTTAVPENTACGHRKYFTQK